MELGVSDYSANVKQPCRRDTEVPESIRQEIFEQENG
jgi:hypothetical protein